MVPLDSLTSLGHISLYVFDFFYLTLIFLKRVQNSKALYAQIYLISSSGGRQVLLFPNFNPNFIHVGTTAGFVKRSAVRSPEALEEG